MAETKTTEPAAQDPLLDLNTLIERPTIKIDDRPYEILSPEEISILDSQRFQKWGRQIEALAQDDEKSDELDALIGKVTDKIMVGVPEDLRSKLSNAHKMRILAVFTGLLLGDQVGAAGATLKVMSRSIGANSSPGSSASSAARPAGGSKKPQPQS